MTNPPLNSHNPSIRMHDIVEYGIPPFTGFRKCVNGISSFALWDTVISGLEIISALAYLTSQLRGRLRANMEVDEGPAPPDVPDAMDVDTPPKVLAMRKKP